MDEYISRAGIIAEYDRQHQGPPGGARKIMETFPAADVRPVVLCRDCKRYGGRPWENNESGICARTDVGVGEFDFCSYGEKREEDQWKLN